MFKPIRGQSANKTTDNGIGKNQICAQVYLMNFILHWVNPGTKLPTFVAKILASMFTWLSPW